MGVDSVCGGGELDVTDQLRLSTTNVKWPQYPPLGEEETKWTVITGLEVLPC
jgi:hypothetical protein